MSNQNKSWQNFGSRKISTVDNSYRWPNNRVWWKWDWYQLGYSIIFKLGQMLHGQMLTVQMSPRQLRIHTDGLTIKPLKFGWVLTSNSGYMASFLLLNYRDPEKKEENFAKPVVDIASSSRSLTWLGGKLGLSWQAGAAL